MGYLSLYRKWRPKTFDDLTGQTTVVKTLKNALINNRIAHAYLFCGPRGTGKTSTAKLFAKALNCEHGPTTEPCNQCFSCNQINSGRSVDVIEIDAASNRRIDEIRDLREKVKFSPSEGDYKVYIIDEVHMLTKEAFNALLKTLEEPPQNVVFILATTEPHKILPTIISRCQRFDFGLFSLRELKERMKYIATQEEVVISDDALTIVARTAEGGMRDAISILDQAIAFGGKEVNVEDVNTILGRVDQRVLSRIVDVISTHDSREALQLVNEIIDQGKDLSQFMKDLLFHFRDLMLIRECGIQNTIIDLPDDLKAELATQADKFMVKDLLHILEILSEADQQLKFASQPRLVLEMVMIKLTSSDTNLTVANLISRLARLEELVESGKITAARSGMLDQREEPVAASKDSFAEKVRQMRDTDAGKTAEVIEMKGEVSVPQGSAQESGSHAMANAKFVLDQTLMGEVEIETSPAVQHRAGQTELNSAGQDIDPAVPLIPVSQLEKFWQLTLDLLNDYTQTRKLRAFLLVSKPYTVIGDTVYIVFPRTSTFHKTHAEEEINLLERALKKVTGESLKAVCIFEGEEPSGASSSEGVESFRIESREQVEFSPETVQQDPIVQKALKVFGGRIIQVENE